MQKPDVTNTLYVPYLNAQKTQLKNIINWYTRHRVTKFKVRTGSLISCALGKHGSASFGATACWYNEANTTQVSQMAKFYTKQSEQ